jgi:branched-chain amino acid aminotransferase
MERAFVYGDLLFESMLFEKGQIPYLAYHLTRLKAASAVLKFEFPDDLNEQAINLEVQQKVQNANETHRIRLVLYRDATGFYLPNQHKSKWVVEVFPFTPKTVQSPVKTGIYTHFKKPFNALSTFKTGNALLYVLAAIWAKENDFDDAFILNDSGRICEATSSNVFWFDGINWFTPPLTEACVDGIGRRVFMENESVIEKPCHIQDLKAAQKIVLSNALNLITEVVLK